MFLRTDKLYGFNVRCTDGDAGKLDDLYFDSEMWIIRYLVVNTGPWLFGRKVLLSPLKGQINLAVEEAFMVPLTREQVENSPNIDLVKPVSRQQLVDLHEYYGWPAYWAGSTLWGTATVGIYPALLAGAREVEKELKAEGELSEKYRGNPYLRSTREVTGYDIAATDGEIGHVEDFFVDEKDWTVRYMLVDTRDWLPGRKVLVSPTWIDSISWPEAKVAVRLSRAQVKDSPEYDPTEPLTREYEVELYRHYDMPQYWL